MTSMYESFIEQSKKTAPPLSSIDSDRPQQQGGILSKYRKQNSTPPPSPTSPILVTAYQLDDIDDERYRITPTKEDVSIDDYDSSYNPNKSTMTREEREVETQPPTPPIQMDEDQNEKRYPESMPVLEPLTPESQPALKLPQQTIHHHHHMTNEQIRQDLAQAYNLVSDVKMLLSSYKRSTTTGDGGGGPLELLQPDFDDYIFVLDFKQTYQQLTRAKELLDRIKNDRKL